MALKPASAAVAYDPVKALQGMFIGSITRIAYTLKDPVNYGPNTRTVLTEVAKRFHDALDDCEIQLLDAKWYLEHQLAENRLKREAKARELGTAMKRKHDELRDQQMKDESPLKKAKVEGQPEKKPSEPKDIAGAGDHQAESLKAKQNEKADEEEKASQSEGPSISQDNIPKPDAQATPADANEFNFESMFGDSQGDGGGDDLGFDLDMDNGFENIDSAPKTDANQSVNKTTNDQDPGSLDALLPGLGDYANQPSDAAPTGTGDDALFGLPEIGGNDFDEFFNNDALGGTNFDENLDFDDKEILDIDFDDSVFN